MDVVVTTIDSFQASGVCMKRKLFRNSGGRGRDERREWKKENGHAMISI